MNCDEYEIRILADPAPQLSVNERAAADQHLATCTACQAFARQLQHLDAELTIKIQSPGLSASFDQRLANRIQAGSKVLSAAQRAERKRQLQQEYATGLAELNRWNWAPDKWLAGLSYTLPVALAGWLAWHWLPRLVNLLGPSFRDSGGQGILFGLLAATVFVVASLMTAFPERARNLWPAN